MRLDKYLKVTHLIRRRGQAKEYIDAGYASVNDKLAKPATDVKVGDIIALGEEGRIKVTVEVLQLRSYCPLNEVTEMYRLIKEDE